ncbi:MAG: diguanylate cyclase [bacterium]|nr:diguanylate cyclase [bacterium]
MSIGKLRFARMRLAPSERVNPFRSLPARISLLVFGATLLTSLIVTGISVEEMDDFLRGKIELKFPEIAQEASLSLNAWYDQQILNLGVLAASDVLRDNVEGLKPGVAQKTGQQASRDVSEYLAYVLDRFDHFDALFVLRPDGEILIWVGSRFELPEQTRDRLVASGTEPKPLLTAAGDSYVQIVSLAIRDVEGKAVGLLSAVTPLSAVADALRIERLDDTGKVLLIDHAGVFVAASKDGTDLGVLAARPRSAEHPMTVIDYRNQAAERVVSYAVPLSQYDLTLTVEERYSEAFAPLLAAFRRVVSINLAVVLLFGLAAFRVAVSIARPIEALSDAARRIAEDEPGVELPENEARDEVGVLTRTFRLMWSRSTSKALDLERSRQETEEAVQQMSDKNAELQRANEVLEQLSITDGLTKLHNHRYFQEQLAREIRRADRTDDPLALVLIDIDHFKKWNDELGHAGGDEILRKIAQVMNDLVRETDILARYGGEEFALILPKTEVDGAHSLAEKIRAATAESRLVDDLPSTHCPLTVSIGVNVYTGDQQDLFEGADRALYRAKDSGRDCVVIAGETDGV